MAALEDRVLPEELAPAVPLVAAAALLLSPATLADDVAALVAADVAPLPADVAALVAADVAPLAAAEVAPLVADAEVPAPEVAPLVAAEELPGPPLDEDVPAPPVLEEEEDEEELPPSPELHAATVKRLDTTRMRDMRMGIGTSSCKGSGCAGRPW